MIKCDSSIVKCAIFDNACFGRAKFDMQHGRKEFQRRRGFFPVPAPTVSPSSGKKRLAQKDPD